MDSCAQLIYVTNDDYPLGRSLDLSTFHGGGYLSFDELTPAMQEYIKEKAFALCMTEDDLTKLSIMVLGFSSGKDPETRHKNIRAQVRDLLYKLEIGIDGSVNDGALRDQWGLLFQENAGNTDTTVVLSKEDFIWPIVVMLCRIGVDDAVFLDYEDDLVQDVLREYDSIIEYQTQRFELVTKIIVDFKDYKTQRDSATLGDARARFIELHWRNYIEDLGLDAASSNEIGEIVSKRILQKILYRQRTISAIKRGVNLAD